MPPSTKRGKSGKNRVRGERKRPSLEERRVQREILRAAAEPRHSLRLAPPADPLAGIVTTWDLGSLPHVKHLVDLFYEQVLADKRPWKSQEEEGLRRLQLPLDVRGVPLPLEEALRKLRVAVLASCPSPCPRCGEDMSLHSPLGQDCAVNQMREGAEFHAHRDRENAVALIIILPIMYSGGLFRVATVPGDDGFSIRGAATSTANMLSHRARDMLYVPLPLYTACVVDGHHHGHEISRITFGVRWSLVMGFRSCKKCKSCK